VSAKIPGRIITFYSYKGGTGRSMALANIGWILASNGKRVLMVDWDLEAPGLHRYFHPFLQDKNLTSSPGIIDLVMSFEAAAIKPQDETQSTQQEHDSQNWYLSLAEIEKYTQPLAWTFPQGGVLDLLPAGRQDASYAARTNSFDWARFYDKFGGGVFLEAVKNNMRRQYDYILIDSRTGVSDVAGVSTVQMPDWLVVCFTLNIQSIEGSAAIAGSVRKQRTRADTSPDQKPIRIFPVPTRVEYVEKERLETARASATKTLSPFLDHLPENVRAEYWGKVEVPYVPFYAFEEVLATIADTPGQTNSLLSSLERLTSFLTDGEITRRGSLSEDATAHLRNLYRLGVKPQGVTAVLSRYPEFQSLADRVTTQQKAWLETKQQDEYLLGPSVSEKLQMSIELLGPLLQDRSFHEFWEASQRSIQRRQYVRTVLRDFGVVLILAGCLAATFAFTQKIPFLVPILAGSLGASISLLPRDLQLSRDQFEQLFRRPISNLQFVFDLLAGAVMAVTLTIILESGNIGIKVTSQSSRIALMVLAGYTGRFLLLNTVDKVVIKSMELEKDRPKVESTRR
jgi:cellulose biosynthesis protein BcsQ